MRLIAAVIASIVASTLGVPASAQETVVRIGQGVPTLSFLPPLAARALDTFKDQGLRLEFVSIRGGDPATLAALDAGDIDFAATGSDTALEAIVKGQPFQIVYSLMSQVTLDLVVSHDLLKRTGVTPTDPLARRLSVLKGATIGVSAVGGTQDRAARWLAAQGGLNPQTGLKVVQIGPPPAIQAALDHGQIDGFVLSPPEGALSEQNGSGQVLIRMGTEFANLHSLPYLVLVAKKPMSAKQRELAVRTARALQSASQRTFKDPAAVGGLIQQKFYPKLKPDLIIAGITAMRDGIAANGQLNQTMIGHLLTFTTATGGELGRLTASSSGPNAFWTNSIVAAALKPK